MSDTEQREIPAPARDKRAIEAELEKRLRSRIKDTRGTLTLSGQDAHKQADLFGKEERNDRRNG